MSSDSTVIRNYTNNDNYIKSDDTKIAAGVSGKGALLLIDNAGQTFNEDFNEETDFTGKYDNTKAEFGPINGVICRAIYDTDINIDNGYGTLTGVSTGTVAITANFLDLTAGGYVSYTGLRLSDLGNIATIEFDYKPDYTGTPTASRAFFGSREAAGGLNNRLDLSHATGTGNITVYVYDEDGSVIQTVAIGSAWSPTADVVYRIAFCMNTTTGDFRVLIDGTTHGTLSGAGNIGVRGTNTDILRIGSNYNASHVAEGSFANLRITKDYLYTGDYTPSAITVDLGVQQKEVVIADEQCYLPNPTSGPDALRYQTSATGTAFNGATTAIVNDKNYIALLGRTNAYYSYNAANAQLSNNNRVGTFRFKIVTAYSGLANTNTALISVSAGGDLSRLTLVHESKNSNMRLLIKKTNGTTQSYVTFANWTPTDGVEYEMELNIDLANGASELFIDGVSWGTAAATLAVTAATEFTIGHTSYNQMFYIRDVQFFNTVQHTADFTSEIPRTITNYQGSKVEAPQMVYPNSGSIQAFTNFVTTQANDPQFIFNDLYYNSGWVASDGTFLQSSTKSVLLANIATLPAADTINIDVVFDDSISKMNIDDLTLTYTGQIYSTANPWIKFNETTHGSEILDFLIEVVATGSDAVKFAFEIDGSDYYITGSTLTASDGYAKTNTAAEVLAEKELWLTARSAFRLKVYLHSDDGSTTPTIDSHTIGYDASLPDVDQTLIDVNGFFYKGDDQFTEKAKYRPFERGFINEGITYVYDWVDFDNAFDSDGFGSQDVPKNPAGTFWEVKLGKESVKFTLETTATTSVDFADLEPEFGVGE